MPRSEHSRHPNREPPEPIKRAITAVIQFIVATILLIALVLIVEYATDPQVRTFEFLFR